MSKDPGNTMLFSQVNEYAAGPANITFEAGTLVSLVEEARFMDFKTEVCQNMPSRRFAVSMCLRMFLFLLPNFFVWKGISLML
jgi:hypothetical protein